jgi:hypothetical protein
MSEHSEIEVWRPVRGDGGKWIGLYEVSSLGRVRSLDRVIQREMGTTTRKGRVLKPTVHPGGYLVVGLTKDGHGSQRLVHRLVAYSFHGDPPGEEYEAAHEDGDRLNPRLDNVSWKTKAENAADKRRHGTNNEGSTNARANLTTEAVLEIVRRVRAGESQLEVSDGMGVPAVTVNHIMCGRTWASVTGFQYEEKRTRVTMELADKMATMKLEGMTLNAIAAKLGTGSATVFRNYKKSRVWKERALV